MATDCCNQNGMRGYVSALDLGVIAGETPDTVHVVKDPHGEWSKVEKDGHVAFLCGELVMTQVGEESALPLDLERFDFEAFKPRLVPFAQAGKGLYRTWMEVERHPWDGQGVGN